VNVKPFLLRQGATWSLRGSRPVLSDMPSEENGWSTRWPTVCTLDAGSSVKLLMNPTRVKGTGSWVAVFGSAVR
jgi:hypothetical protein